MRRRKVQRTQEAEPELGAPGPFEQNNRDIEKTMTFAPPPAPPIVAPLETAPQTTPMEVEAPQMAYVERGRSYSPDPSIASSHTVKRVPVPALLEMRNPFGDNASINPAASPSVENPFADEQSEPAGENRLSVNSLSVSHGGVGGPSRLSASSSLTDGSYEPSEVGTVSSFTAFCIRLLTVRVVVGWKSCLRTYIIHGSSVGPAHE